MKRQKNLAELLMALPGERPRLPEAAIVTGLALDSRKVQPGDLFVALKGGQVDGHRFIPDALRRGASAVVGTEPLGRLEKPYIQVADGRLALAYLSAAFFDFPAHNLFVIGVTGTDGKTTTANLIYQVLTAGGLKAGMITTVNALIGDETIDTGFHVTTPEAPDVQNFLARMVASGLTHVVLEATSHGLAQHRVAACNFDVGVVTNITHEHLDYHGDYAAYRDAKARLFSSLAHPVRKPFLSPRAAVLNRDDQSFPFLTELVKDLPHSEENDGAPVRRLSYGLEQDADVFAQDVQVRHDGIRFVARGRALSGKTFQTPISSHLVGAFNVSNCLAAITVGAGVLELPVDRVRSGIAGLLGVPGRMESIDLGQPFTAIVDFAHTPNALKRSLEAARKLVAGHRPGEQTGRVIAVFGSAGLRDRMKRRMMAETSAGLADFTILTAEDPRTESLEDILAEMASGAESRGGRERSTFWRIADRGEAIRFAVRLARPGDVVIVCGKGHEQSMCFGETEYSWDDRTALRAALAGLLGVAGPEMPYLPTQD